MSFSLVNLSHVYLIIRPAERTSKTEESFFLLTPQFEICFYNYFYYLSWQVNVYILNTIIVIGYCFYLLYREIIAFSIKMHAPMLFFKKKKKVKKTTVYFRLCHGNCFLVTDLKEYRVGSWETRNEVSIMVEKGYQLKIMNNVKS